VVLLVFRLVVLLIFTLMILLVFTLAVFLVFTLVVILVFRQVVLLIFTLVVLLVFTLVVLLVFTLVVILVFMLVVLLVFTLVVLLVFAALLLLLLLTLLCRRRRRLFAVCFSVCLSASISPELHVRYSLKGFLQVAYGRFSFLLWGRCDMLYTSGIMDASHDRGLSTSSFGCPIVGNSQRRGRRGRRRRRLFARRHCVILDTDSTRAVNHVTAAVRETDRPTTIGLITGDTKIFTLGWSRD